MVGCMIREASPVRRDAVSFSSRGLVRSGSYVSAEEKRASTHARRSLQVSGWSCEVPNPGPGYERRGRTEVQVAAGALHWQARRVLGTHKLQLICKRHTACVVGRGSLSSPGLLLLLLPPVWSSRHRSLVQSSRHRSMLSPHRPRRVCLSSCHRCR